MCFGTAGLDPALESFSDEGLELLMAGMAGAGGGTAGGGDATHSPQPPTPPPALLEHGDEADSSSFGGQSLSSVNVNGSVFRGVQDGVVSEDEDEDVAGVLANGGHSDAGTAVAANGGSFGAVESGEAEVDMSQFDADSVVEDAEVRHEYDEIRRDACRRIASAPWRSAYFMAGWCFVAVSLFVSLSPLSGDLSAQVPPTGPPKAAQGCALKSSGRY